MKIGVGTYAYRWSIGLGEHVPKRPLRPKAFLVRAAELGAEVVQFADNLPLHREDAAEIDAVARAAKEHSVDVELGTDGASVHNLNRYLLLADTLDAPILRVTLNREDLQRRRSELLRDLAAAGDAYAAVGRVIGIENHFLLPSRGLADLVGELNHPAVGVCLDVANSIANQEWPQDTIARLAPFAVNLHIKDYRMALDPHGVGLHIVGTPVGEGSLDVAGVFAALKAAGRDVNAIVEHWIPWDLISSEADSTGHAIDGVFPLEEDWTRRSLETIATISSA